MLPGCELLANAPLLMLEFEPHSQCVQRVVSVVCSALLCIG